MFQNQIAQAEIRRNLIVKEIESANEPLTVHDLYEKPEIRSRSTGIHNVAYDLKTLRSKKIRRIPSPVPGHRYAYMAIKPEPVKQETVKPAENSDMAVVRVFLSGSEYLAFLKGYMIMNPDKRDEVMAEMDAIK